jgi:hypothetical protein
MTDWLRSRVRAYSAASVLLCMLVVLATLFRLWLALHLPSQLLPHLGHDDGLQYQLAKSLAAGDWLGAYHQRTLAKGMGYPMFLAATHLSGLPVSLTHGLFHLLAAAGAGWAVARLTGSRLAGIAIYVALALEAVALVGANVRVYRTAIYWAQIVLVHALACIVFYRPLLRPRLNLALAFVLGLCFAWTWLTREEGVALAPGLIVLAGGAALAAASSRARLVGLLRVVASSAAGALLFFVGVMTLNSIHYGSFLTLDMKDRNFVAALSALQSVRVTEPVSPYVPVPLAARRAVASISPAFAPLAASLGPGGRAFEWRGFGCKVLPETCGDIAGGWFIWALRDAMALEGGYASPAVASARYATIAADIKAACASGKLLCEETLLPYLPRTSASQWASLPRRLYKLAGVILFSDANEPMGLIERRPDKKPGAMQEMWTFVNKPRIAPEVGAPKSMVGWYHNEMVGALPVLAVEALNGKPLPATVDWIDAPVQDATDHPTGAERHWFRINYACPVRCRLVATLAGTPPLRLAPGAEDGATASASGQTLYLDHVSLSVPDPDRATRRIALRMVSVLLQVHGLVIIGLVVLAVPAFAWAAGRLFADWRRGGQWITQVGPTLAAALSAWLMALALMVVIALIDATSWPALNPSYAAPVPFLVILGSVFSIHAGWRLWRGHGHAAGEVA